MPPEDADEAVLGRPAALTLAADRIYIADSQDCAIKVFSRDGKFVRAFGRKGRGPGEFSFPSGVAAAGDRVYVADKLNRRIQIFDHEGGLRGGFP
ncbi:MAG: 6-bladed beta-propeller [Candidatus Moduliflexus flocculans]|nr:6-bladed beta-propeller [Candidatus Moduliflexus flocculans]